MGADDVVAVFSQQRNIEQPKVYSTERIGLSAATTMSNDNGAAGSVCGVPPLIQALLLIACLSCSAVAAQEGSLTDMLPRGQIQSLTQSTYGEAVKPCEGLGSFDNPAFTRCMQNAAAKADSAVNTAFKEALRIILPERRNQLVRAQKAWLTFYRLNCDAEKSLAMTAYYDCILKMAIERSTELRNRIGD